MHGYWYTSDISENNIDYRFGWIDKFLPIYNLEDFENIDWNPIPIELENVKKLFYSIFAERLDTYITGKKIGSNFKKNISEINKYYSDRNEAKYNNFIIEQIKEVVNINKGTQINCLIWGVGRTGNMICRIINKFFESISIIAIVDSFKKGEFNGIQIISPQEITTYSHDYIFIATTPGRQMAEETLKAMKKCEFKDYSILRLDKIE